MNEFETMRVIGLVERTMKAFDQFMPRRDDQPLWKVAAHLLQAEYSGKLVTITSLCSVSELPYATSRRYIRSLIDEGLIEQVARSRSGKTNSLHPSEKLKRSFEAYIQEVKSIIAEAVGGRNRDVDGEDYYFGAPRSAQYAPPAMLRGREAGNELNFLVNNDDYFAALRNLWADFRSNLGSAKNFSLLKCAEMREELIKNSTRTVSQYDIVSVNVAWLSELAGAGMIQPIADLLDDSRYASSVADADLKSLGVWQGRTYGVPIYCSVNVFATRSDLFEQAALKVPSTFDDVIDAGRKLTAEGRYGIVWDAAPGSPVAQTFMSLLAAAGGSVLSPRGPRDGLIPVTISETELADIICSEAGRRTLAHMHRMVEISPPEILKMAWDRSAEYFVDGHAAMFYGWSMRANRFEYHVRSAVKRKVKYLAQPAAFGGARASPLSGFLLAIPANVPRERARLAVEAIGWLISAESGNQTNGHGLPLAPRFATTADPEMKACYAAVSFVNDLARKGLIHTRHRPATPHYASIEAILGDEIHAALRGDRPDDVVLSSAARRVARLALQPRHLLDIPRGPVAA
jgi:multiple sugar transport system substrate-binding protein